jgi:hypothetical protein
MDRDFIVAVYPQENTKLDFNFQLAYKKRFYPLELEVLINEIYQEKSELEIERAIEFFYEHLTSIYSSVSNKIRLIKKRELTNLVKLFILSMGYDALQDIESEYILTAISMLKDQPIFTESKDSKLSLAQFDNEQKLIKINQIKLNPQSHGEEVHLKVKNGEIYLNDYPLDDAIELEPANTFYENLLLRISFLDNFTPILDAGLTASIAIIKSSFDLFQPFPDILEQKFIQYTLNKSLDLFGLRKLVLAENEINFSGISFNQDRYFVTFDSLTDDLKYFILLENPKSYLPQTARAIMQNNELTFQIRSYLKNQNLSLGALQKSNSRKISLFNKYLGFKVMEEYDDENASINYEYISFAYLRIADNTDGTVQIYTNFSDQLFPKSFLLGLDNFYNPMELFATGPLELFNYQVQDLSLHFEVGDYIFKITSYRNLTKKNEKRFSFAYGVKNVEQWHEIVAKRGLGQIEGLTAPKLSLLKKQGERILHHGFKSLTNENTRVLEYSTEDISQLLQFNNSMISYIHETLKKSIGGVLLNQIIAQVYNIKSVNLEKKSVKELFEEYYIKEQEVIKKQSKAKSQLDEALKLEVKVENTRKKIEDQINHFNPKLYIFFADSFRRGSYDADNTESETGLLVEYLEKHFHEIKLSFLDKGLTANEWTNFSGLEIFEIYSKQTELLKQKLEDELTKLGLKFTEIINHETLKKISVHQMGKRIKLFTNYFELYEYSCYRFIYTNIKQKSIVKAESATDLFNQILGISRDGGVNVKLPPLPIIKT